MLTRGPRRWTGFKSLVHIDRPAAYYLLNISLALIPLIYAARCLHRSQSPAATPAALADAASPSVPFRSKSPAKSKKVH